MIIFQASGKVTNLCSLRIGNLKSLAIYKTNGYPIKASSYCILKDWSHCESGHWGEWN